MLCVVVGIVGTTAGATAALRDRGTAAFGYDIVDGWSVSSSPELADATRETDSFGGHARTAADGLLMVHRSTRTTFPTRSIATNTAQRGPKPWPEGPHNQTIQRRIGELEEVGMTHRAGGNPPEEVIPTPGGCKTCLRPDITMTRLDGSTYRENVGRTLADGSPVPREVSALDDLEAAIGTRPGYTAYDR